MATTRYVYSGGSNTSPYDTWAKGATAFATVDAVDAAGDTTYVASDHAETTGAAVSYALGSTSVWSYIYSANRSANPPTASGAGGKITTNASAAHITFNGQFVAYGLVLESGSGQTNTCNIVLSGNSGSAQRWIGSAFRLLSSGSSSRINATGHGSATAEWIGCTAKFSNASQGVGCFSNLRMIGGGLEAGGTSPTAFFAQFLAGATVLATGLDLSAGASGMCIFTAGVNNGKGIIRDSKLPASWSGTVTTGTLIIGERYEMYNCSDGSSNYWIRIKDNFGSLVEDTGVYRNSGYSMDGTPMSWKVTGVTAASWPTAVFWTPEFGVWVPASSGYTTVTVAVATNNITLTDQQCWLEVVSLDSASFPIGTWHADDSANVSTVNYVAAASNQTTDGTSTWTGVPGTPVLQKLTATIAPGMSGYILCRVGVAISGSQSVYIDPHPQLA